MFDSIINSFRLIARLCQTNVSVENMFNVLISAYYNSTVKPITNRLDESLGRKADGTFRKMAG